MSLQRFKDALRAGCTAEQADLSSKCYKGGGGGTTTVEKADPWVGAQPFLTDYMQQAANMSRTPRQYYGGQTIAAFRPEQEQAFNRMMGDQYQPSMDYYGGILGGGNMDAIANPVAEQIASKWAASGRYGSPGMGQSIAKGVTEAITPYQMQAAAALPQLQNMQTANVMGVGDARQRYEQMLLDEERAKFEFGQNEPRQRLQEYASLVSPGAGFGGQSSMTQPGGSRAAGMLGGGLMGASLASSPLVTGFSPLAGLGAFGGLPLIAGGALLGGLL